MPPPRGEEPALTDPDLALVLRGERDAVRQFIDRFGPILRARVRAVRARWINPPIEEEDLLQTVLAALFKDRARVLRQWDPDKGRSLPNFLRVFATHRTVEALRRRSLEAPADPDTLTALMDRGSTGSGGGGVDWIELAVAEYLAECDEGERRFFKQFLEGDKPEELASAFHLSVAAVYQRISRFRKRIIELGGPEAARWAAGK